MADDATEELLDAELVEVTDTPQPENRQLGRYRLRFLVAQGGMGAVYLAQLDGAGQFQRWVAVKLIHGHIAEDRRFVEMLLDEARITSQLTHPNVCSVIDFGQEGSDCFLVMEYLHGESLASVLKRAWRADGLPWEVCCRIVVDAARGLHAAHELHGRDGEPLFVVHRDVSPQNLLVLYEGITKVLDFGVARARGNQDQTRTGEVKGKLAYMAPEQLSADTYDRRVDVWALGVVLFESVAGKRLFRGENEGRTIHKVLHEAVPSLRTLRPDVPAELQEIVERALTRDPEARFATAADLADALEELLHRVSARAGPKEVALAMGALFADKRAMRDHLLIAGISDTTQIPVLELDSTRTLVTPSVRRRRPTDDELTRLGGPLPGATIEASATAAVRRRRGLAWAAFGVASVLLVLGGVFLAQAWGRHDSSTVAWIDVDARDAGPSVDSEGTRDTPLLPPDAPLVVVAEVDAEEEEVRPSTLRNPVRARVPETRTGTLNLVAVPTARVYEGSRSLGETPLVGVTLTVGTHRLELRTSDGAAPRRVTVIIREGELSRESVR